MNTYKFKVSDKISTIDFGVKDCIATNDMITTNIDGNIISINTNAPQSLVNDAMKHICDMFKVSFQEV